jgi:hypothetical protein
MAALHAIAGFAARLSVAIRLETGAPVGCSGFVVGQINAKDHRQNINRATFN